MRDFLAPELGRLFPEVARATVIARCETGAVGQGRYLKDAPCRGQQFADVAVQASPAPSLAVRLRHEWPASVRPVEAELLDTALVRGLIEGVLELDPPALGCELVTRAVAYTDETSAIAVQIAARLAFQDLARRVRWNPDPFVGPNVA